MRNMTIPYLWLFCGLNAVKGMVIKMKLKDYILYSDVDGTLLPYVTGSRIPQRNIEAIKRFTEKGGKFGIATGRARKTTKEFIEILPVNAPCVVLNGGGLYDFKTDEYLMRLYLPDEAKAYVKQIMSDLPDISALVIVGEDYYHLNREIPFESFTTEYRKSFKDAGAETMEAKWCKALFSGKSGELAKLKKYLGAQDFKGVRFVETSDTLTELLPENSDKGEAIKTLAALKGYKMEHIAAIGDYYNDFEMLQYAGVSAVPIDTPDDIKAVCDFIAGKCEDGAVADFIEYLESICDE